MHSTFEPRASQRRAMTEDTSSAMARVFTPQAVSTLLLLVWWVTQMVITLAHPDPVGADAPGKAAVAATAASSIESGGSQNALLVASFAALGAWHLARAWASLRRPAVVRLLGMLGLYVMWAAASVFWSADVGLTVRRLAELLFLIIGSVGLGLGLYGKSDAGRRLLVKHLLAAGIIAIGTLWFSLVASGNANILDPAYSAKDLGLWTISAHPIALSVFAAVYLWHESRMRGWQFALFVLVWAASLFVQKVRFITGYSMGLLMLMLLTRVNLKRIGLWTLPLAFVLSLGLANIAAFGSNGVDPLLNTAWSYVTIDQGTDNITGLSGRADLWSELQAYSAVRPELGYGFGAFWTPDHLQRIALALTWAPTVAHNGYLDEILATGFVGLLANVAFWLAALAVSVWRAVRERNQFAWLTAACVAMFLLLNWGDSIMQLYFRFPFYAALTVLFALLGSAPGTLEVAEQMPHGVQLRRGAAFAAPRNRLQGRVASKRVPYVRLERSSSR